MKMGYLPRYHCYCLKFGFTSQLTDNEHLDSVYFLKTTKYTDGIKRDNLAPPPKLVDHCVF